MNDLEAKDNLSNADKDSKNWQQLKSELEEADKALLKARTDRDELLKQQRQSELAIERLEAERKALAVEEGRLGEAVEALGKAHKQRRDKQKDIDERRIGLEKQQKDLMTNFDNSFSNLFWF